MRTKTGPKISLAAYRRRAVYPSVEIRWSTCFRQWERILLLDYDNDDYVLIANRVARRFSCPCLLAADFAEAAMQHATRPTRNRTFLHKKGAPIALP